MKKIFLISILLLLTYNIFSISEIPIVENNYDYYYATSDSGFYQYQIGTGVYYDDKDEPEKICYQLYLLSVYILDGTEIEINIYFKNSRDYLKFTNDIKLDQLEYEFDKIINFLESIPIKPTKYAYKNGHVFKTIYDYKYQ